MKNNQMEIKTEVREMRKKLATALTGVTLCLAFAANPGTILAEEDGTDIRPGTSLRQSIDADGDGIIDADEKAAFRERYLNRFDRNNDGKLDRNERRHARQRFDRAEDRWDRREDKFDRREDRWDRREDRRDRWEDVRDRREDRRDRREDKWDRREDRRDRREDMREFKRDRRQYREHVSRREGRARLR